MNYIYLLLIFILASCSVIESGSYYKVSATDDPIIVSARFKVSLCSLRESNKKRKFKAGEYIFIPRSGGLYSHVANCGPTENLLAKGDFAWPIKGKKRISSRFGARWNKHHNGIDIPSPMGTPIRAAREGRVSYSGYHFGGYGNLTIISHIDGSLTYYAHAKKNYFKKGKRVEKGKIIALVGSTGSSTGPHLHFEIRKRGIAIDPLEFYSTSI